MPRPTDRSHVTAKLPRFVREWFIPIAELTIRLAAIALAAEILLIVPLPLEGTPLSLIHAVVAFAAVALVGIAIYETLFYDRYHP